MKFGNLTIEGVVNTRNGNGSGANAKNLVFDLGSGTAGNANGGSLIISPGLKTGSGIDGGITLMPATTPSSLKFVAMNGTSYTAIKAASTIPSNYTLVLPNSSGQQSQALTTDGLGNLNWSSVASEDLSFITFSDETTTPNSRQLVGTINQTVLEDSGAGSTLAVSIANNPIIPGSGSLTLPSGMTSDRPGLPTDGMVRFNDENSKIEVYENNQWEEVLTNYSAEIARAQTVIVQKNPTRGQFSSVAAALASITDSSPSKPYSIQVEAGVYEEPQITMKPNIHIIGQGTNATFIKPINNSQDFIIATHSCSIQDMSVGGPTNIGYNLMYVDIPPAVSATTYVVYNIRLQDAYQYLKAVRGGVGLINVTYGSSAIFTRGFEVVSSTNPARISMANVFTPSVTTPYPEFIFKVDGTQATLGALTILARGKNLFDAGPNSGIGIWMRNGGTASFQLCQLVAFEKAVWIENAGAAPRLTINAGFLFENDADFVGEHPGTTGCFQGTLSAVNSVDESTNFTIVSADLTRNGTNIVGSLYLGETLSSTTDVTDLIQYSTPVGVFEGGNISVIASDTIRITEGSGYYANNVNKSIKSTWVETDLVFNADGFYYIFVNQANIISSSLARPDPLTNIILAAIAVKGMEVDRIIPSKFDISHTASKLDDYLRTVVGPIVTSGGIITENVSNPRQIDTTAVNVSLSTLKYSGPAITNLTFTPIYHASGVWTYGAEQTVVDNAQYDNGTDLVAIPATKFVKHTIYGITDIDGIATQHEMVYGNALFDSLAEARSGPISNKAPSMVDSVPLAALIVESGGTNITEIIDVRPRIGANVQSSGGPATSHSDLTGLDHDDHLQYLPLTGSRAMVGDLNLGNNDITNVGLIDNINILSHGTRHNPNGADPITTGVASSLTTSSTNTVGIANSVSRSDHTHAIVGFQPLDSDLTAIAALSADGLLRKSSGTWAMDSTVYQHFDADLAAIAGLAGTTGILRKIAADTWELDTAEYLSSVTLTGDITGTGTGTISTTLADSGVSAGTYKSVTVNSKGLVTAGTNPTTLSGYGITDAQPLDADLTAIAEIAGTGLLKRTGVNTWALDESIYLTGNQAITVSGDATGSGTTSIPLTLATVNSNIGIFAGITVNAKGLVTAATTLNTLAGYGITDAQPLDADLSSLASQTGTGLSVRSASNTWTTRTIVSSNDKILVTNGDGVSGNPTLTIDEANFVGIPQLSVTNLVSDLANKQPIDADLTAIAALTGTSGFLKTNGSGTWSVDTASYLTSASGVTTFSGGTTGLTPSSATSGAITLAGTVAVGHGGTGQTTYTNGQLLIGNTTGNTLTKATLTAGTNINITNGAGSITINATDQFTGTVTSVAATQPSAGLTITGSPITTAGTLTFALANDLASVENLSSTGLASRIGTDSWAVRTITGTANQVTMSNGDGVSGNPTIAIANNPILPGVGSVTVPAGLTSDRPGSPVNGMTRYNSTIGRMEFYQNGAWVSLSPTQIGSYNYGNVGSTNGTTTYDISVTPLITDGTQLWSQTVTPISTASRFDIKFSAIVGVSNNNRGVVFALYRGNTFLSAAIGWMDAVKPITNSISFVDVPNTTSPVTYSLRVGLSGGGGTWYVNTGNTAAQNFGGSAVSSWTMTER